MLILEEDKESTKKEWKEVEKRKKKNKKTKRLDYRDSFLKINTLACSTAPIPPPFLQNPSLPGSHSRTVSASVLYVVPSRVYSAVCTTSLAILSLPLEPRDQVDNQFSAATRLL